jgi:hypothetical protein
MYVDWFTRSSLQESECTGGDTADNNLFWLNDDFLRMMSHWYDRGFGR